MMITNVFSYKDIAEKVRSDDGISTISMFTLRVVHGTERPGGLMRLGVKLVKQISDNLSEIGISHEPLELPTDQSAIVLLFEKKGTLGRIMEILNNPIEEKTDERIYNLVNSGGAQDILEKIRVLVSDSST